MSEKIYGQFDLETIEKLADIVKKTGSLCKLDVGAKFRRHETCDIRNFE